MNTRYIAGLSLAVMASGFLITLFLPHNSTWVFLLQGGFEAGLVGGIADWFAVTALFRHPFGLPIPHTSLLLKNRDKIVNSLISAMENELLNKESIENKIKKLNLFRLVSAEITKLIRQKKIRTSIVELLIQAITRLPLEKAVPLIQSGITAYIRELDMKNGVNTVMTRMMNQGYDEKALDYILHEAADWSARPDTRMLLGRLASEKLNELRVGGLMGFAFQAFIGFMNEEKLGGILQNLLESGIRDLLAEENAYRSTIIREIRVRLFLLAEDDERLARLKELIADQIEGDKGQAFLHSRMEHIRAFILSKLQEDQQRGGRAVFAVYRFIVRKLNEHPEQAAAWEDRLTDYVVRLVEANHYRIGKLVKENLEQMDDATLVRMLEEKVGKDLQWIRVNGALCGFAVGIVLSLIQL
ncbi:hypothetical protein SD71_20885 [Cohnella kolymensis]|uniref:DUF445 domain-containing protein n=1 Tax=Cohnella kolymensis TaxID=1590652 RepID=A0ABR4ZZJ5_9BACL|nr:DUF445 domain-containing protein [Cohnella kolymensis]KIL34146.1 hypothetical protein SD71_20885 [Cohnella kolymensis]